MRKEENPTPVTPSNETHDIFEKKPSFLHQFSNWFKDFINNAD